MKHNFLFTSKRLGFRNWIDSDLESMANINANSMVMEHFPSTATQQETFAFIKKMKALLQEEGFCYFATVELETNAFIGFIGFARPKFNTSFMPCIDMGWRLSPSFWGMGYATEGALRCLKYGFKELGFKNVKSIAPVVNKKSIQIMKKIGMTLQLEFTHPLLKGNTKLEKCVCYEISRS
ncbi:MAG: GNAT family N-acetyltransferase [Flavobacteriales bacterium]|nr:GNAT family N-acetyltransferase [Flavobacteriales bacterium]